jgi:hypothetical protein
MRMTTKVFEKLKIERLMRFIEAKAAIRRELGISSELTPQSAESSGGPIS